MFEKTEKGGRRKLLIPQIKVIVSLNMATGKKLMSEYKTIDLYLTSLSSDVSQMMISNQINELEEQGWTYKDIKIIDDCNVMLMFSRDKR